MAVQAHLQSATAAATRMAQSAAESPSPVPIVNFSDAWKATNGFASTCAPDAASLLAASCPYLHKPWALSSCAMAFD